MRTIEIVPGMSWANTDWWDLVDVTDPDNRVMIATVYTGEKDALIVKRALEGGEGK
jgi:hypothetical protein